MCANFEGQLVFRGRVDEELKISGQRIHPAEVERALCGVGDITAAVVWGSARDRSGTRLRAVVESSNTDLSVDEIRRHAGKVLPSTMGPSRIEIHSSLPRSTSGKID